MRRGFTLIELMIVIAIIAIIAAIAIPSLLESRKASNEAAAIQTLKTIATAQSNFNASDKDGDGSDYAATLAELLSYGLLDSVVAAGTKTGYIYTLAGSKHTWTADANPEEQGKSGDRSFFIDESGIVRFKIGSGAAASDTPLK